MIHIRTSFFELRRPCLCGARSARDSERNCGSVDNVLILFFGHFFSSTNFISALERLHCETLWRRVKGKHYIDAPIHLHVSVHHYIDCAQLDCVWRWFASNDGSQQIRFCRYDNRLNRIDKMRLGFVSFGTAPRS